MFKRPERRHLDFHPLPNSMKTKLFSKLSQLASAVVLMATLSAHALTTESPAELLLSADLDGDSRLDLVIVDRVTGGYRIGYQLAPGVYTWAESRGSGVQDVTSAQAGRLFSLTHDTLAFASPVANRVNLLEATSASAAANPTAVFVPGVGPNQAVAFDIGGLGNTAHADLFITTSENGAPTPNRRVLLRNNAGTIGTLADAAQSVRAQLANVIQMATGSSNLLGVIESSTTQTNFVVYSFSSGAASTIATAAGVPRDGYVFGRFAVAPTHQFLLWRRGSANLINLRVNATTNGFSAPLTLNAGANIEQVFAVLGGSEPRLLIVTTGGAEALLYGFDGQSTLSLAQTFLPPEGETFSGVFPFPDGNFKLLSGIGGRSSNFHDAAYNGSNFTIAASGALPAVKPFGIAANVFLFQNEPFVSGSPRLMISLNAADWSSQPVLVGAPKQLTTLAEGFGSTTQGLFGAAVKNLGTVPSTVNHALPNQYREPISLSSMRPAIGDEVLDVTITPPGGPQRSAVRVVLNANQANASVLYRTRPGVAWSTANSTGIWIYADTTIEFYGQIQASDRKTRVQTARYTFPESPSTQDSDGDGVPDYVEVAKGLDPTGGTDGDGDGYTDLEELLAGFDPLSATNFPPDSAHLRANAVFDIVQSPRPMDGVTGTPSVSATGTPVRVHNLPGAELASALTRNISYPGVSDPAASITNVEVDTTLKLLTFSTEFHYAIATPGTDKLIGRELVAFEPMPPLEPPQVNYQLGIGSLNTEANNWLLAASNAYATLPLLTLAGEFGVHHTLSALLVERKLNEVLLSRAVENFTSSNLTLFPFRAAEVNRRAIDSTQLRDLQYRLDETHPGYDLVTLDAAVDAAILPPGNPALNDLRKVASEVYRISSLSNNAAPGLFPLPIDVLREFLFSGELQSNYLAAAALTPAERASAFTGATGLLASLNGRPTTNLNLEVTADSFSLPCTTLQIVNNGSKVSLFFAPGVKYQFPDNFDLVPGSRVTVVGYSDLVDNNCTGADLEVISAALTYLPPPPIVDTDGDLLPDAWECLFGGDPNGDLDGDGNTDLQEYLDGTDAKDANSKNPVQFNLGPPKIFIALAPNTQHKITWNYPLPYADKMKFDLWQTDALGQPYQVSPYSAIPTGNGNFEIVLPAPPSGTRFYLLTQSYL
jgi:hypothetical protein